MLSNASLVEHALRNTLVADALSLQFRLPPPNAPPPTARSSVSLAGGAPCVSTLLVTSVWAVHLLRLLALVRCHVFKLGRIVAWQAKT